MAEVEITLLTRPNCSLCGPVRRRVEAVAARTGATWEELDVDQDPDLQDAYTDLVPVVLVDGQEFSHWRVDEDALVKAVRRRQRPRLIRRLLGDRLPAAGHRRPAGGPGPAPSPPPPSASR